MVKINVRGDKRVRALMDRIAHKFPKEMNEATFEFCKLVKRNLRWQLTKNGSRDNNTAWNSIQARYKPNMKSHVVMSQRAIWLDRMTPHYVPLNRGRNIIGWVQRKYGTEIVSGKSRVFRGPRGGVKGFLWVEPRPFFDEGFNRSLVKLPKMLQEYADRGVGAK